MLLQFKKMFEDMVVEAGQNLDSLDKEKTNLIEEVKEMRNAIETMLKDLEEKIIKDIGTVFKLKNIKCLYFEKYFVRE